MRALTLSLSALTALTLFGLSSRTPASADAGCITAKTWVDPANGHAAYGDNSHDDWQNLQDMINYALLNNQAVKFEPGQYRITKTLVLALAKNYYQVIGFRMSGIAGPNPYAGQTNGVGLIMDANSTTQPAVLEIGQGAFYDTTIESIGLSSLVPNYGTPYGLLFAEQEYSHVKVEMVTVSNVGTDFANIQGTSGGGNGEDVNIDNCSGGGMCFYSNSCGQALYHRIHDCQAGGPNGATAIKIGSGNLGFDLDVTGFSYTFGTGPLRNTFIENDGVSGTVNVKGGRLEWCDTLLTYSGGSYNQTGHVEIRGIDLNFGPGKFPILDATLNGRLVQSNGQYTNTISNCTFGGVGGPLSLAPVGGDFSKTFFEKCSFGGFSNKLTDLANVSGVNQLQQMGIAIRDCRAAPPTNNAPMSNMSYP